MRRRSTVIQAGVWTCLFLMALSLATEPVQAGDAALPSPPPSGSGEPAEEEEDELRQRLTEREDKRRPAKPWSIELAGRPLAISGEYEINLGYLRRRVLGDFADQPDRLLLEQGLDVEAFYSFGQPLSLFAQARVAMEEDLFSDTLDEVSDYFVERGEMWLYSENIAGSGVNFDLGRLDFEDERRWWWDEELDAVRIAYETESLEVVLSVARELGPSRSDRDEVDPVHDRVLRVIGEASWDWRPNCALELFALYQDDHSPTEQPGHVVDREWEDDSDARLGWFGARLMGVWDLRTRGILGYWLDTALVRGEERLVEFEELSRRRSVVEEVIRRDVRGWAVDAGLTWILPTALEPRLFAGYAFGSGDRKPEEGADRSFRQTGIQANEAGFGGVERFSHYGVVLDPELSNLRVLTIGAGLSLLRSSSLDLVYHYYRLAEPAPFLRDARLEATLTGEHRDLGHGVDLVLALEEWERLEFELIGSAFRPGRAFGEDRGEWSYGGFVAMRIAF
jgi:hypothetical protein